MSPSATAAASWGLCWVFGLLPMPSTSLFDIEPLVRPLVEDHAALRVP
jgi:hypothetical protein